MSKKNILGFNLDEEVRRTIKNPSNNDVRLEMDRNMSSQYYLGKEISFDINNLSDSKFKDMIIELDNNNSCPTEYLLSGLLATCSGTIGTKRYIRITPSQLLYFNLWIVLVGPSTISRKTTSINIVTHELYKLDKDLEDKYKIRLGNWQKIPRDERNDPEPERDWLILPTDSTLESLAQILSKSDRGLIITQEFGGYLRQLDRTYSQGGKQFLTAIYDVPKSYKFTRKTAGNTFLERPYVSILGASTIDWINKESSRDDVNGGFFPRILFVIRNRNNKQLIPLVDLCRRNYQNNTLIKDVYNDLLNLDESEIILSEPAIEIHREFDITTNEMMANDIDNQKNAFYGRLIPSALKFSGIISVVNQNDKVTENDMNDAIHIANFFKLNDDQLLENELTRTEQDEKEKDIIKIIKQHGNEGCISKSVLLKNSHLKSWQLKEIIDTMEEKDSIPMKSINTGGNKPTTIISLK